MGDKYAEVCLQYCTHIFSIVTMQFSPTSEHLLLAYGRRHSSLLKSIVIDGETTVPVYTILEVLLNIGVLLFSNSFQMCL